MESSVGRGKPFPKWHHAPLHLLIEEGIFMVTAGTTGKVSYFNTPPRLELLTDLLFNALEECGWQLHAWAVLSNHYHFIARSPGSSDSLKRVIGKIHMLSAKAINAIDTSPARQIWHQYWDVQIRYEKSYLARLNYVNQNPVKHGVVRTAAMYRWCSAASFAGRAGDSFARTVAGFPMDRLKVRDDF